MDTMTINGKWERDGKFLVGDIVVVESSKPFGLLGWNLLTEEIHDQLNHHEINNEPTFNYNKGCKSLYWIGWQCETTISWNLFEKSLL